MGLSLAPHEIVDLLVAAIPKGLPIGLVGPPGVGKTAFGRAAADILGYDLVVSHPGLEDQTEPAGLPVPDLPNDRARKILFGQAARVVKATRPTIWFLDDLGQAPPSVQAAYMPWLSARQVDDYRLPDYVTIMAASNRRTDRAGVSGWLEPVKSRFATLIPVSPLVGDTNTVDTRWVEDWAAWAMRHPDHFSGEDIGFLRQCPAWFFKFEPTLDLVNSPNPRTWEAGSGLLKLPLPDHTLRVSLEGAVGSAAAADRFTFRLLQKELPRVEAVLANPAKAPVPDQLGILYTLVTSLGMAANGDNFGAICGYFDRLVSKKKGDFAVLMLRDAVRRDGSLLDTPAGRRLQDNAQLMEMLGQRY